MYRIGKKFTFDASHQLEGLPEGHKCGRLHGHTYTVEIVLAGESLSKEGWLVDFGEMAWLKGLIDDTFDHRHLNDALSGINPTSENLAKFFFDMATKWMKEFTGTGTRAGVFWVDLVRVSETPNTFAEYWNPVYDA